MAELSVETQAILDRLKKEGDLVRNSGTNSIRSVKVEMEKFRGVFDIISANVIEQTSILQRQAGLAAESLEAARTKEQLDEIQESEQNYEKSSPVDNAEARRQTDENINRISDAISNALSLKNLVLGAAGLFVGYNFLKGFIDEKYNSAWTNMEEGIAALGPKLKEFATFDFNSIRTQFDTLTQDISGIKTSLAELAGSLKVVSDTFKRISEMGWIDVALAVLGNISLITAGAWGLTYVFKRLTKELEEGTKPRSGRTWWQRALGINPDAPDTNRPTTAPTTNNDANRTGRTGETGTGTTGTASNVQGGRGSYGMDTVEGRAQMRAQAAAALPNQFRLDSNNRLQRVGSGGFVSDKEAVTALENALKAGSNIKYAGVFSALSKVLGIAGVAFTAYDAYRIYSILSDDKTYPTEQDKINAIGPIIGPLITSMGAGAIGAAAGFFVGGPWGALIGGAAAAIAAGLLTPDRFGIWIASALFNYTPQEVSAEQVMQRERLAASTNEFAGYMDDPSYNEPTPVPATRRSTGAGGGRGTVYEKPGERAAYLRDQEAKKLEALLQAQIQQQDNQRLQQSEIEALQKYLGITPAQNGRSKIDVSAVTGASGATNVVYAPTINAPVSTSVGGDKIVATSYQDNSGGGGMRGGASTTAYGLTAAFN